MSSARGRCISLSNGGSSGLTGSCASDLDRGDLGDRPRCWRNGSPHLHSPVLPLLARDLPRTDRHPVSVGLQLRHCSLCPSARSGLGRRPHLDSIAVGGRVKYSFSLSLFWCQWLKNESVRHSSTNRYIGSEH